MNGIERWMSLLRWIALSGVLTAFAGAGQAIRVTSELKTETAWMGERVTFHVTLYSPGPFSGTPVFQIPEIRDTVIAKEGTPVVGSAEEAGESWITQRHEFALYTQQVGKVEIPGFKVAFESKDSFLGDPVPREGISTPIAFTSERPPGTEALPFVVSSATLEVSETWSMDDGASLEAGDVVTRSITRSASDTSAMFLEPFEPVSMDGVKVYVGDPGIEETSERGVTRIQRTDYLKYQFTRGGTFDIPSIRYSWWDPEREEIRSAKLDGRGFIAKAPPVPPEPTNWKRVGWIAVIITALGVAAYRWIWPWLVKLRRAWHRWYHAPMASAARALRKACRADEERKAYQALIAWKRAAGIEGVLEEPLGSEAERLARRLFGSGDSGDTWNGGLLLKAFHEVEAGFRKHERAGRRPSALPPLNPGWRHGNQGAQVGE